MVNNNIETLDNKEKLIERMNRTHLLQILQFTSGYKSIRVSYLRFPFIDLLFKYRIVDPIRLCRSGVPFRRNNPHIYRCATPFESRIKTGKKYLRFPADIVKRLVNLTLESTLHGNEQRHMVG